LFISRVPGKQIGMKRTAIHLRKRLKQSTVRGKHIPRKCFYDVALLVDSPMGIRSVCGTRYNFDMRTTILLAIAALASGATVDQYLGAPFASELHAAPGGGKVVWILIERGARNLWVAGAPDFKGRRLTSYKEDDGQDVGMIEWTHDGKSVVY